jgi:hypothetical protein
MASSRGGKKMWCIPHLDEEFVERMEDLLTLYEKPLDPMEPVVCLDEKPVQCLDDKRRTIRVRNGSYRRDYEYVRRGTANVFCALEPKAGRHFTRATPDRKKPAFARMVRRLAKAYPDARTIHLVMDNLSTHSKRALTDTFGVAEGELLWSRFTVHYTPKHGSWLDQAEIEVSIFSRQCLGKRRIGSFRELQAQTTAWRRRVNRQRLTVDWKFTVTDARRKFRYSRRRGKITLPGD